MTVHRTDATIRFGNFRTALDACPKAFDRPRDLLTFIGDKIDELFVDASNRYDLKPCNCDGAFEVEAAIYAWMTRDAWLYRDIETIGKEAETPLGIARIAEINSQFE